jgi:hypothetical protein
MVMVIILRQDGDVVPKLDVICMTCVERNSHFDVTVRIHVFYIYSGLLSQLTCKVLLRTFME